MNRDLVETRTIRGARFRRELVKCGKPGCSKWHGPYWYGYKRDEAGRLRSWYVGAELKRAKTLPPWEPRRTRRVHKKPPPRFLPPDVIARELVAGRWPGALRDPGHLAPANLEAVAQLLEERSDARRRARRRWGAHAAELLAIAEAVLLERRQLPRRMA